MGHFLLCEGPASKTFYYVNLPTYWAVRQKKLASRKRSSNRFSFTRGTRKTIWRSNFSKKDCVRISSFILFPCQSFSQTEIQKTGDCCALKLFRRSVRWKTFDTFSEWNLRFQFPQNAVTTRPDSCNEKRIEITLGRFKYCLSLCSWASISTHYYAKRLNKATLIIYLGRTCTNELNNISWAISCTLHYQNIHTDSKTTIEP